MFSGRVEAKYTAPASTTISVSSGALTSAVAVTLPAASYYHSAAGGVSSGITALQTAINSAVGAAPDNAASLASVIGGTWTSGAGYLCQEASGNLAAAFGSPATLTANGSPTYRIAGPGSGTDYAVGFPTPSDYFSAGDAFDVTATDDLLVAWVGNCDDITVAANRDIFAKVSGSAGWRISIENTPKIRFWTGDGVDTVVADVTGAYPVGWYVGIAAIDRAAGTIRAGVRALSSGTQSLSTSNSTAALGDISNATALTLARGLYNTGVGHKMAGFYVVVGSGAAAGIPASLSTALSNFASAISSSFSVALSTTDGRVTIANSHYSYSLTWTSTTLRDLLGFDANITSQTTATGAKQAKGIWFPDCPVAVEGDPERAPIVSDSRSSMGPTGRVITLVGNTYRRHRSVVWSHVPIDRVWSAEATYDNASWEEFFSETQLGQDSTWFRPGSQIQIYDHNGIRVGADSATLAGWSIIGVNSIEPQRAAGNWTGLWRIELPRIMAVGS